MLRTGPALALSFFFAATLATPLGATSASAADASPSAIAALDTALWAATRAGGQAIDYEAYLERFPEGRFAGQAQTRLAALRPVTPVSPEAARRGEAAIELDRSARRDIQERLAVLGYGAGGFDGLFGPATRREIGNWQRESGISATGYLDLVQITRLIAQTDGKIASWRAARRAEKTRAEEKRAEEHRAVEQQAQAERNVEERAPERLRTVAAEPAEPAVPARAEEKSETGSPALIAFSLGLEPKEPRPVAQRSTTDWSTLIRPSAQYSPADEAEVGCQK